ncbi:MAG: ATP-dependent DNA ligase [Actinomycetota bacterium]|nr:ATP-dependent DNA ligase [Actinomycetota bacterium]
MQLPVMPPLAPMLAKLVRELPQAPGMTYEPKWDGFRCIVFRDGDEVELGSRNERPLTRYFPELVEPLRAALPQRCVVDGEIVIAGPGGLDFDGLLQRIHPADSRVRLLAEQTPASFVAFDLLVVGDDDLRSRPFRERRARLEEVVSRDVPAVHLTPATTDVLAAADWFSRFEGAGLDGVIAKAGDLAYVAGKRLMLKVKHERTADCVVGGFRWHKDGDGVGSLLLGLYDEEATLHHVGVATSFKATHRRELAAELAPLSEGALEGHPWRDWAEAEAAAAVKGQRLPGGASRWNAKRDTSWEPLPIELVVEVSYDNLQGDRFRHATHLVRWRPDRDPASCTYDQLDRPVPEELAQVFGAH